MGSVVHDLFVACTSEHQGEAIESYLGSTDVPDSACTAKINFEA